MNPAHKDSFHEIQEQLSWSHSLSCTQESWLRSFIPVWAMDFLSTYKLQSHVSSSQAQPASVLLHEVCSYVRGPSQLLVWHLLLVLQVQRHLFFFHSWSGRHYVLVFHFLCWHLLFVLASSQANTCSSFPVGNSTNICSICSWFLVSRPAKTSSRAMAISISWVPPAFCFPGSTGFSHWPPVLTWRRQFV